MSVARKQFTKALISLIFLFFTGIIYLNLNIREIRLNYQQSILVQEKMALESRLAELKLTYNQMINQSVLEGMARDHFQMELPQNNQIQRIKDEKN